MDSETFVTLKAYSLLADQLVEHATKELCECARILTLNSRTTRAVTASSLRKIVAKKFLRGLNRRMRFRLGKILLDGGFVSADTLEQALKSQTKRPLGQVLISMGALKPAELKGALALQSQLVLARDLIRKRKGKYSQ